MYLRHPVDSMCFRQRLLPESASRRHVLSMQRRGELISPTFSSRGFFRGGGQVAV
jgi:hypothetical protein